MCRHVVVYRALNEATAWRTVTDRVATTPRASPARCSGCCRSGAFSGPTWMGHWATRHMHEFGTTREQFAAIALNGRRNAQKNPKAVLQDDLTMEDYLSSKMISDPLCLFDCDIAVDGVTALIVSTADYAPDVPTTAIHFEAVGRAARPGLLGPVGGHGRDGRRERRRAPLADRPQAGGRRRRRTSTTASACSRSSGWKPAFLRQGRGGPFVEGGSASRSTANCRWPRAAASSRPAGCTASATSMSACNCAARRRNVRSQGREGRGDVGGRRAARLLPAAEDERMKSRQVQLVEYPRGPVEPRHFRVAEVDLPDPGEGEILVRNTFTSVDPGMRLRLRESGPEGYFNSFPLNAAMDEILTVGEVVESRAEGFSPATRSRTRGVGATTRWSRRASSRSAASGRCAGSTRRSPRPSSSSARWATWP